MSLKEKALRGVKWTTVSSVFSAGLNLVQIAVLSRLLAHEDFGIMAIALVLIGFSQIFLDLGISNAIIAKQDITKRQLDSLYWMNVFCGLLFFLFAFFSAPAISRFYKEPELVPVIRIISISFLIQPFEQQFLVLLKKELRFNEIAKRDITAKLVSSSCAIVLALYGYGVYALAYASVVFAVVSTTLLITIGLRHHRPSLYFNYAEIRGLFRFGFFQMGENSINYFNTQFDSILIGKLLGPAVLGIYNIGKNLPFRVFQIFNPIVTQITFPVLAKLQNDRLLLKQTYLNAVKALASINFPIYIFMAVFAEPITLFVFGPNWMGAVDVVRILSLYMMVRSIMNPVGGLVLSVGKPQLTFYWNLAMFFLMPLAIYAGSFFGLTGIAMALLCYQVVTWLPAWKWLIKRSCGASLSEYAQSFQTPLAISLCQVGLYGLVFLAVDNIWIRLVLGVFVMIISGIYLTRKYNATLYAHLAYASGMQNRFKFRWMKQDA